MTIETKYNIGEEVWFKIGFTPTKGIVRVVKTENERFISSTKEELLNSLQNGNKN